MGESYILLFLNFKRYEDDELVHFFQLYTSNGVSFDEKNDVLNIITVEIPKAKYSEDMNEEEIWAYMFQSSGSKDLNRENEILSLMRRKKEIDMLVECASEIQRSEKE